MPTQPPPGAMLLRLSTLFMAHRGPLPTELLDVYVEWYIAQTRRADLLHDLLARPELTQTQLERLATALSDAPGNGSPKEAVVGAFLARLDIADVREFTRRAQELSGSPIPNLDALVEAAVTNPHVREELLDVLESSTEPKILAAYAHHSPRGLDVRIRALAGLGKVHAWQVPERAAQQGAKAIARLFSEDVQTGRAALRSVHVQPVLLALGGESESEPWWGTAAVTAHLDEETASHLIREAVLPVLSAGDISFSQNDRTHATALLLRLHKRLPDDLLALVADRVNRAAGRIAAAELHARQNQLDPVSTQTLQHLLYLDQDERASGAAWLLETLADAAAGVGWAALLRLADEAGHSQMTCAELCAVVRGVTAPSVSAPTGRTVGTA